MDIRSAAAVSSQAVLSTARAGAIESVVQSQKIPEDAVAEAREIRPDAGADRGQRIDIDA